MAVIQHLPTELLSEIVSNLSLNSLGNNRSIVSVLRVSKRFNALALPFLYGRVIIRYDNLRTFPRGPRSQILDTMKHLEIELHGGLEWPRKEYEKCFMDLCCRSMHPRSHPGDRIPNKSIKRILGRLDAITGLLPHMHHLKSFRLEVSCYVCDLPRPFITQSVLCGLLASVGKCSSLEDLNIDTQDCEIPHCWHVTSRPESSCGCSHVCPTIAKMLTTLPNLSRFRLRRRDLCAEAFALGRAPSKRQASACGPLGPGVARLPKLKEFIIDLRLPFSQKVDKRIHSATTRRCGGSCQWLWYNHVTDWRKKPLVSRRMGQSSETERERASFADLTKSATVLSEVVAPSWLCWSIDLVDSGECCRELQRFIGPASYVLLKPHEYINVFANRLTDEILGAVTSQIIPEIKTDGTSPNIKVLSRANPQSLPDDWTPKTLVWNCVNRTVKDGESTTPPRFGCHHDPQHHRRV